MLCPFLTEDNNIMATTKKTTLSNEKGFALLAAIIASMILLAVAMLIINMSVGDLISSSMTVGNKKGLAAAESGVNKVLQSFDPSNPTNDALAQAGSYTTDCVTNPTNPTYQWLSIPGGADANTQFAVCTPVMRYLPFLNPPGYSIGSDTEMGYVRYDVSVVGKNTSYGSTAQVDFGIGFGPVPINH